MVSGRGGRVQARRNIQVSDPLHARLLELQQEYRQQLGRTVSIAEVIERLVAARDETERLLARDGGSRER